MRTTIELPEEVFQQARRQAAQRGVDVSQFISRAVMKLLQASAPVPPTTGGQRVEFPIIHGKPGAPVMTQEVVDRAEEQMLKEESEDHARSMRC